MQGILLRSFRLNIFILELLGLYPSDRHNNLQKFRAYVSYFIAMLPASVLCLLQFFLKGNISRADTNDIASIGMIFLAVKFFAFLVNSGDLQLFVTRFDVIFSTQVSNTHKEITDECIRICVRNSRIFFVGVCLTVSGWMVTLCFQDYRSHLPLNVWFPFHSEEYPKLYYFTYFMFILGVIYTGMGCATIDPLIPGLLCHASGQVQLLKENLKNLDRHVRRSCDKNSKEKIIYKKIRKLIIHHEWILDFVSEYEKCCSPVIFMQFIESIVVIGLCCLQIIQIQAMNINLIIMINYLFTFLFQVYFYCYYGTILLEENNTLSSATYMSNWYEYDRKSKRSLIILMERSKRPLVVSAGKVLNLSLETFTLILNRSYSLIAVFKNMYQ